MRNTICPRNGVGIMKHCLVNEGVLKYGNADIDDEEIMQILEESENITKRKLPGLGL